MLNCENLHLTKLINPGSEVGLALKIVDETNPIPKYLQISAWIKELIQTGRYKVGEKLPSEVELSKMCGVNRNTLRQAISELTAVG
ncbi:MAG: winged helix-turn-helix domain-containing protein, partial [Desulfobacterales bacterium]